MTARIGGHTRVAAVIGHPVQHSASPRVQNAAFAELGIDAVYVALDVLPRDLPAAIAGARAQRLLGINVTLPYKQEVVALCDSLSDGAREIGAVNCLELSAGGQLVGHNTDGPALIDSLDAELGGVASVSRIAILGGGGAARAAAFALRGAGVADISVIVRRPDAIGWWAATPWDDDAIRRAFAGADLVVDCTSIELSPDADSKVASLPLDVLAPSAAVMSLLYSPRLALLEAARARGHRAIDGRGMLIYQAARSLEIWTGRPAPLDAMWRAFAREV